MISKYLVSMTFVLLVIELYLVLPVVAADVAPAATLPKPGSVRDHENCRPRLQTVAFAHYTHWTFFDGGASE